MTGIVVLFDFDQTIIDGDSDKWVVVEMGLTQSFQQLRSILPWNTLMDRMLHELHSQGRTIEEIEKCLKRVPMNPRIAAAIKAAHDFGCDLKVVSDANNFYIETILKHHGLLGFFSEIYTNPTSVDEVGRLRIFPYRDFTLAPHGCSLCSYNMCKGLVIEQIRAAASENGKKRFIYVGDGKGDFCPSLKLGHGDYVMPRKNYPLWNLICGDPMHIKAQVLEWSDGEELEKVLLHLIDTISIEENISNGTSTQSKSSQSQVSENAGTHP